MASRVGTLAAAVAALAQASAATVRAAEDGPYPIWWSPALELESLDDIDARLDRELWPGRNGLLVFKEDGTELVWTFLTTCAATIELTAQGYYATYSNAQELQWKILSECRAIEMLKHALPAKQSYVRDFHLEYKTMSYLPGLLSPWPSCYGICWYYAANEERVPWSKPGDFLSILWRGKDDIEIETDTDESRFRLLSRADFNGDGIEDIVILSEYYVTEGTYGMTDVFVLTRDSSEGVFWVLGPDRYLCPDYQCRGPYDFSEANPWPAPGAAIAPGR